MSILEQAIVQWRRVRQKVSDHRETNVEAWLIQLQRVLADHGLSDSDLAAYLHQDLRGFVEEEYEAAARRPR